MLRVFAVREKDIVNRFMCAVPTMSSKKSRSIMIESCSICIKPPQMCGFFFFVFKTGAS